MSGRGNRISGNGLSSYGDGSVSAVCHNGNQQDGIQVNNVVDAEPCEGDAMDTTNVISRHETGRAENSNCLLVIDPFSAPAATTLQVPSKACPCEMVISICIKHLPDSMLSISFNPKCLVLPSSWGITFFNLCADDFLACNPSWYNACSCYR